ncbi:hypothetical protein DY000_02064309 [Brassica cretica]|uniref:Uncharacterized protein n=2 Tax=Brassica TaxID=3705 RepID=A0ABQ7B102_BRACR|nr:hypothetical protein DY000_02064309 [Brassica cretica]VDD64885.1 unnamed protein product [Brassica oleracea]
MGRMEEIIMERARRNNRRMKALQNVIDNQKKELDAAIAEKEKECLKHAAIDTGNLEVLTFHHWFCETVGFVRKTKEHRD